MFNLKKKILFGVSVSMVLAMAIGSFALSETQTPASPRAVEAQNSVGANAGAFTVNGGTQGTDYEFTGTSGTDGVLTIHPQSIETNITISNTGTTTDRIEVTSAATITLNNVNIAATDGAALEIADDAAFNVNILLADNSENSLDSAGNCAGLQKNGEGDGIGELTIGVPDGSTKPGQLKATGSAGAAGIGGEANKSGSKIRITGGIITAKEGGIFRAACGAGIGGGENGAVGGTGGNGSEIVITGGIVTATGNRGSAGIGGGSGTSGAVGGNGSKIEIKGGVVTANGGVYAAGIGGGFRSTGSSENKLDGDAVLIANGGYSSTVALQGFDDSDLKHGIAFTHLKASGVDSWSSNMYGDSVTITENATFPADLTIADSKKIILESGKTLTIPDGVTLKNEGTITVNETGKIECSGEGKVTTLLKYDPQGGNFDDLSNSYQLYKDSDPTTEKKYQNLPNPSTNATFNGWNSKADGTGNKIDETKNVDLNLHKVYADMHYTVTFNTQGGSDVTPASPIKYNGKVAEPTTPPTKDGYKLAGWYKEAACINQWKFDKDTIKEDTTLYANWAELHTISISKIGNGEIAPDVTEAAKDDTVTLTVTPAEGYQLKEGSLTVKDADGNEVPVTEQDGKYTFTMPGADVTVSAAFELIPEPEPIPDPSIDPGHGGDSSDASSKTSDSFAGIAALAILGLATTGAVMLCKRK